MKITTVAMYSEITCPGCKKTLVLEGVGDSTGEAEKALHEDLEAENWTDGLCPDCAEKKFLK